MPELKCFRRLFVHYDAYNIFVIPFTDYWDQSFDRLYL